MSTEREESFSTPEERCNFFVTANSRNESIPSLIKDNRVLQEKQLDRTMLIRILGLWFVRRGSVLERQHNIEAAMTMVDDGTPMVTVSDHQSDSDHAIKRVLFERYHYREFSRRMLYLGGLKMKERKDVGFFAPAENMLLIPTPFDFDDVEKGLRLADLTADERHTLTILKKNYTNLSVKALKMAITVRKKDKGRMIGLYPESTRSRTGLVGEARAETNAWFRIEEGTFILPISVEGGNYFHPPGTFPWRRSNTRVVVGEPFPFEKIEKSAMDVPKSQREQFIADYAFSLVVNMMNPKYIHPEKRNHFRQFVSL